MKNMTPSEKKTVLIRNVIVFLIDIGLRCYNVKMYTVRLNKMPDQYELISIFKVMPSHLQPGVNAYAIEIIYSM